MSIKEVISNKGLQDNSCLVLLPKPIIDNPKPPRNHRKSKFDLIIERLDKIDTRIDSLDKSINGRIDKLVKLNNLKE